VRRCTELDVYVGELVQGRDGPALAAALQAAGVSSYPVQNCLDLRSDENLLAFDFWPWLDQTECGPMPYDGLAYRLSRTPGEQSAAPNLGEHTEEVLGSLLGMTSKEIDELVRDGVLN
jgi:crotonobetainyl-CoA:carnitine CoA-transferase CaiB-like acyl-CoA transferase